MFRQIFYNLIQNSLKHGHAVTEIKIYYEERGTKALRLVYEDDGGGIPKGEKEKIFQEGYGKGTGYGLYLVKKLCDVYGWTIKETGTYGNGARFVMTIPKIRANELVAYQCG
jgi:signal transduction histidine kinase